MHTSQHAGTGKELWPGCLFTAWHSRDLATAGDVGVCCAMAGLVQDHSVLSI